MPNRSNICESQKKLSIWPKNSNSINNKVINADVEVRGIAEIAEIVETVVEARGEVAVAVAVVEGKVEVSSNYGIKSKAIIICFDIGKSGTGRREASSRSTLQWSSTNFQVLQKIAPRERVRYSCLSHTGLAAITSHPGYNKTVIKGQCGLPQGPVFLPLQRFLLRKPASNEPRLHRYASPEETTKLNEYPDVPEMPHLKRTSSQILEFHVLFLP